VFSGDDADDSVIAFLNDVEKVEAAASDVNKLPAVLHADRVVPVNSVQLTFGRFWSVVILQFTLLKSETFVSLSLMFWLGFPVSRLVMGRM